MPLAIVRDSDQRVITLVRDDVPEGWEPPEGCTAIPAEQLPAGWQRAEPPAQSQEVRIILSRLTNTETSAIFGSADPLVIKFRSMALAVGTVSSADPDAQAGFAYLVSQGLLTSNRPAELLAP